jgi:hypothetical protein
MFDFLLAQRTHCMTDHAFGYADIFNTGNKWEHQTHFTMAGSA